MFTNYIILYYTADYQLTSTAAIPIHHIHNNHGNTDEEDRRRQNILIR